MKKKQKQNVQISIKSVMLWHSCPCEVWACVHWSTGHFGKNMRGRGFIFLVPVQLCNSQLTKTKMYAMPAYLCTERELSMKNKTSVCVCVFANMGAISITTGLFISLKIEHWKLWQILWRHLLPGEWELHNIHNGLSKRPMTRMDCGRQVTYVAVGWLSFLWTFGSAVGLADLEKCYGCSCKT